VSEAEAHNFRHPFVNFHVRRREWREALALIDRGERHAAIARWWLDGRLPDDALRGLLLEWWPDCDFTVGGGTQDVNLAMFQAAAPALGAPLPEGDHLRVCREQASGERPGISWRLDYEQSVAASGDGPGPAGGTVLCGDVDRSDVLGYFVGEQGGEVIVDPACVRGLVRVTAWRRPSG
jgi:hypothetical protein